MSFNIPSALEDQLPDLYGLSPVWRGLTCDLMMSIIDYSDRSTLKSWSCVNRLLGLKAQRRLWNSFSSIIQHNFITPVFYTDKLDALARKYDSNTVTPANHPLCEPTRLIENLEMELILGYYGTRSSQSLAQPMDQEFRVCQSLSSLQNVRGLSMYGHIPQSVFEPFLAVGAIDRIYLRVPLEMKTLNGDKGEQSDPDNSQMLALQAYNDDSFHVEHPVKLQLLANHRNLRVLSIHDLLLSEIDGLAIAVRTLRLDELDVSAATQINEQGIPPMGCFLMALCVDSTDLNSGGDLPPLRFGFPATLKKLVLNDGGQGTDSIDLGRILGNATVGCENIMDLHLNIPSSKRPPLALLGSLHLPALRNLSHTAHIAPDISEVEILEDRRGFRKFCIAHKFSLARVKIFDVWKGFHSLSKGSRFDAMNKMFTENSSCRLGLRDPALQLRRLSPPLEGRSKRFHSCSKWIEQPGTMYVARELRLAVGEFYKNRIYDFAHIIFSMDQSRGATEKLTRRWGTELTRICLDYICIDRIIWNLDHITSLLKLRILAINQVRHSDAFCIGHVDAYWSLTYDSHLCKESPPRRYGDGASNACPAKRRVLKSMATALVQLCAKQLPSIQVVYLDTERFWIEREDGQLKKVWRLWDAMDDPVQKVRIERDISLEDWTFLSCQNVDDTIVFLREECNDDVVS